jgi:hypothetical protein
MDVKIKHIDVHQPQVDLDFDRTVYDLPYEIHVSVDGHILKTNVRKLIACYESKSLLSLADSYDYLSEEGKSLFIKEFLKTFLAPLVWKIKWNYSMSPKEKEAFKFAMERLKIVDNDKHQEFIDYIK